LTTNTISSVVVFEGNEQSNATVATNSGVKPVRATGNRTGRHVSAMSPRTRAIHALLEQFYDFSLGGRGLGVPRHMLARLIDEGIVAAGQPGSVAPRELTGALRHVKEARDNLRDIRRQSLDFTYGSNYPIEVVARQLNTGEKRAYVILCEARASIGDFISGRGVFLPRD
jgi:hypothetical protein